MNIIYSFVFSDNNYNHDFSVFHIDSYTGDRL